MSSRTLRKLQREQDEKRMQLEQPTEEEEDEPEVEISSAIGKKPFGAFDMLTEGGGEEEGTDEGEHSDTEPQLDGGMVSTATDATPVTMTSKPKSKSKKKRKNKKTKAAKGEKGDEVAKPSNPDKSGEEEDEIDQALASLSMKKQDGSYAISHSKTDEANASLCRLLEVESRHLNALTEMKKLFGNITENEDEIPQQWRRRGRGPQHLDLGGALAARHSPVSRGQGLAGLSLRRNVFMLGKEEWPKATSGGLGMEIERKDSDGTTHYRYVHNTAYQDVQRQFQSCVESMDPQRMIQMLQFNPYHISTILQVSEIAKQQGDHSVSGDLLERALFSFGRSVHSSFTSALAEGKARIDFRRPENREFWLAGWRYIGNLGQRGTWRTTYEWAKLLLALDPRQDPYCVRMIIDQLALRGGQAEHFLKLCSCPPLQDDFWMNQPNICISAALAHYKLKHVLECRDLLRGAVQNFPWIFASLYKELNIEHIPKCIWGYTPVSEREKLECEFYVHGAKGLWNTPEAISFLVEVVDTTEASFTPRRRNSPITIDEARHVLLSGTPQLISLIPREFTSMSSSSSDPLPPSDSIESYSTTLPHSHRVFSTPDAFSDIDSDIDTSEPEEELAPPRRRRPLTPPAQNWNPTQAGDTTDETRDNVEAEATEVTGISAFFSRILSVWPNPNAGRAPEQPQSRDSREVEEPADDLDWRGMLQEIREQPEGSEVDPGPSEEAYDEEANKRWLAGRGMIQLKDILATEGTDERAWAQGSKAEDMVREYVRRVKLLRERDRRFILDYSLRQGAGQAVKDLVGRFLER